jgi:uncharacterized protein (TIGR04255 family)
MLSNEPRCVYRTNHLADVICQLRFPEILTIEANAPVDFQESVRAVFPKYTVRKEISSPRLTGVPGNMQVENQPATNNYQFSSADGMWRINLTSKFISLSCSHYTRWEDFAKRLDLPLAAFIQFYKPALFERIGLRYINAISRRDLSLQDYSYQDLIQPMYLGPMGCDRVQEKAFHRCGMDFEVNLGSGICAKVHAGPGMLTRNGQQDPESKFIFDQDLFVGGNIPVSHAASTLDTIHSKAFRMFRGAITDTLHEAFDPTII